MNVGTNIVKDAHHATNGREEQCTKQDNPYIDPYITVNLQNVKLTSEVFIIFENYGVCFRGLNSEHIKSHCVKPTVSTNA